MRKSLDPRLTIAIVVIVVLLVGYLFVKKAKGPGKRTMMPGVGLVDAETGEPIQEPQNRRRGRR